MELFHIFSPGDILLWTLSMICNLLNVKGKFSHISWYDVKQVPVLIKNGFGLKNVPQHFFLESSSEKKSSP
jgi:hypothetical protein